MKKTFVTTDGVRLAYFIDDFTDPWKEPDVLLMLHSAMSCSQRFYSMVPYLAAHYRLVRLDWRGHGDSEIPTRNTVLDSERLMQDVLELLDLVGVKQPHVLGGSAGGYAAQLLAIHHPSRVKSLILLSATAGFKGEQGKRWLRESRQRGMRALFGETIDERVAVAECDPRFVQWLLDMICKNNLDFLDRFIGHWASTEFLDEVSKITCPTLIVEPGAHKIGANMFAEMEKRIKGSERIVYENARHNIFDYLPERCAQDTLAFLARHFPAR